MDIPKTTAHSYLKTLEKIGYATNEDGEYRLSLRILLHAGRLRHSSALYNIGRPQVDRLARETGEAVNLGVSEAGQRVIIYGAEGENAVWDDVPLGSRTQINLTAIGKAILSAWPESRVEAFLAEHTLGSTTKHSLDTKGPLLDDLEATHDRGYSIENEEHIIGVRAFGMSITTSDGTVIGAISLTGPNSRLEQGGTETDFIHKLQQTANIITLRYQQY